MAHNNSRPDLPPHIYVRTPSQWQDCLDRLRTQPQIAVDLEANSMYVYQEQICLIQISIPDQDYIVDPLTDVDLSGLGDLIENASIEKIFHAAEYDLMLMQREHGWRLCNLFDTMWAARILGYDRFGLASMLGDIYGVRLNKRYQRANWCKRPLSEKELAYAQADTHYLLDLRERLAAELEEAGRMEEAQEIFAEQSTVQLPDTSFDPDSFWSMQGVRRLSAAGKATLKALNIYRDQMAQKYDRPHFKILHDRTLMEVARRQPQRRGELRRIHGMSSGQMRRYGKDILRMVAENRSAPAPRRPPRKPRTPEDVVERYEQLHTWRKERGNARGVESDVIVSRDTLWALAYANPQSREELTDIPGLGPWRRARYADEILELLSG